MASIQITTIEKGPVTARLSRELHHNAAAPTQLFLARISESMIWIIVLTIVFTVRYFTAEVFKDESAYWLVGLILAFALTYYTVIYRRFNDTQRHYIKDIADVIFIGILGTIAKDYSVYLFTLYILPIAAAAFALNIINSLAIATLASLFIAGNVILNTNYFAQFEPAYFGTLQIVLLIILTLFTRALALQLRNEQSQRRFFEEKLREVDQKLRDVEAIEQEFVSITTHQLNTPLSIIRGYTSMLLGNDAGILNKKQLRYIKEIHNGSLRLMKIIQDLLNITHLDRDTYLQHNHQPVVVNDAVELAAQTARDKASAKDITIEAKIPQEKMFIMANETHLREAINNLLDNAIKYSDEKQPVVLMIAKEKSPTGHDVLITVKDRGIGIPAEEQKRIFQRFYRASNSLNKDAQGTGLGLYIVKRIVESYGGSISFNSSLDGGSDFRIRFPMLKTITKANDLADQDNRTESV